MKKKWQEEAFHRLQQNSLLHQHSSRVPKIKDFPKGISAHYAFLSQSIITDLERAFQNINPPTTNNPVMQAVPIRPHNPLPPATATMADFLTYRNNEANAQTAWDLLHPNDKIMNHRPTDAAIKRRAMLALVSSTFSPYSILAQRYHQIDHANKTWADLRTDIESNISNNLIGTQRFTTDSTIAHLVTGAVHPPTSTYLPHPIAAPHTISTVRTTARGRPTHHTPA